MTRQINKPALKRFCTIEEIYNAIKFIIDTEYYTGQNLRLDGGIK
jgi:NAD(P)-dependent dehydrogenase (short-subunit alcohol dehydrogenase family)